MVSQTAKSGAACLIFGFACALVAVVSLVFLDVVKKSTSSSPVAAQPRLAIREGSVTTSSADTTLRLATLVGTKSAEVSNVVVTTAKHANQQPPEHREVHSNHSTRNVGRGRVSTGRGRGANPLKEASHAEKLWTRKTPIAKIGRGSGVPDATGKKSLLRTTKRTENTARWDGRTKVAPSGSADGGSLRRASHSAQDESQVTSPKPPRSAKTTEAMATHRGRSGNEAPSSDPAGGALVDSSDPGRRGGVAVQGRAAGTGEPPGVTKEPRLPKEAAAATVKVGQSSTIDRANVDHAGDLTDADLRAPDLLVCTSGDHATSAEMLPPDGVCDRLFYANVVWREMGVRGSGGQQSWQAFQTAAKAATKTGYGFSVDYGHADRFFATMMTPAGEEALRQLFYDKVMHYGVLNADATVAQLLEDIHAKLGVLKILKQLQGRFAGNNYDTRLDIALGIKFRSYKSLIDSSQHSSAMTALANHLPVTIFVVHTHVHEWGRRPIIGTVWQQRKDESNEPSLKGTAKELSVASIPMRIYVMASFTLMVAESEQQQDLNSSTTHMIGKQYSQLCNRRSNISLLNEWIIKQSVTDYNRTYIYEDAETMTTKANAFFKLYQHPRRGWAVFDTDYEDYNNSCGQGSFSRLSAFKATLQG